MLCGKITSLGGCGLMVKAPGCGPGNCGFESRHSPQVFTGRINSGLYRESLIGILYIKSPCSSIGQSVGLRIRRLRVRVAPGAPGQEQQLFAAPRRLFSPSFTHKVGAELKSESTCVQDTGVILLPILYHKEPFEARLDQVASSKSKAAMYCVPVIKSAT